MDKANLRTRHDWVAQAQRLAILLAALAGAQCASDGEQTSSRAPQAPAPATAVAAAAAAAATAPARPDPPPAPRASAAHSMAELAAPGAPDYWRDVKPVLDARCVSCHACFDAPCQLNLASHEGLMRGASKQMVYMSSRLRDAAPTRLFTDAQTPAQWRGKGFFSVLDSAADTSRASAAATPAATGLLLGVLGMKREPVSAERTPLGDGYDIGTERKQSCPSPDEFSAFAKRHPRWGMPYGLPALSEPEFNVLAS